MYKWILVVPPSLQRTTFVVSLAWLCFNAIGRDNSVAERLLRTIGLIVVLCRVIIFIGIFFSRRWIHWGYSRVSLAEVDATQQAEHARVIIRYLVVQFGFARGYGVMFGFFSLFMALNHGWLLRHGKERHVPRLFVRPEASGLGHTLLEGVTKETCSQFCRCIHWLNRITERH